MESSFRVHSALHTLLQRPQWAVEVVSVLFLPEKQEVQGNCSGANPPSRTRTPFRGAAA